jgi:hypothetical protein
VTKLAARGSSSSSSIIYSELVPVTFRLHTCQPYKYFAQPLSLITASISDAIRQRLGRDSEVGVKTGCRLGRFGVQKRLEMFFSPHTFRSAVRPSEYVHGFFARAKRPRREADRSTPASAKDKNEWSYTSSSICLHIVDRNHFM